MSELLPCPFCQSAAGFYLEPLESKPSIAMCSACFATVSAPTKAEAIAAWNRRATEREKEPRKHDGRNIAEAAPHASYCDLALSDAQTWVLDEYGERLGWFDDALFDKSLAANGYKVVPVALPQEREKADDAPNHMLQQAASAAIGDLLEAEREKVIELIATARDNHGRAAYPCDEHGETDYTAPGDAVHLGIYGALDHLLHEIRSLSKADGGMSK